MHATVDDTGQNLDARMMPFQREGVMFGLKQAGRVLIGEACFFCTSIMHMGLLFYIDHARI